MIVQGLIDLLTGIASFALGLIPPLPTSWNTLIAAVEDLGHFIAPGMSAVGVLVPWDAVSGCLTIWVGLLGFWGLMIGIRVVLWLVNR